MNTADCPGKLYRRGFLCVTAFLLFACSSVHSQSTQPAITSIRASGTNALIEVAVPEGVHRLTLERRTPPNAGAWLPVAVKRLDGSATTVAFTLPRSEKLEVLRARADFRRPLPAALYTDKNTFSGGPANDTPSIRGPDTEAGPGGASDRDNGAGGREVVESDIRKINRDTPDFVNLDRGLPPFMAHQAWGYVRYLGPARLELAEAKAGFQAALKQQPDNAAARFCLDMISRPGPGWRAIEAKLRTIKLDKVEFAAPGVPLGQALAWLTKQTQARDPDHQGIHFILAPSEKPSSPASPQTRLEQASIQLDPGLRDLTVQEALDAIAILADSRAESPVQYTVADRGIIIFSRPREARPDGWRLELVTRPGTRLILRWNVFTNGVLDAASSRTRTYAARASATTNVVSLSFAHGHGSILGVPGGPIAVNVSVNEAPVNDVRPWAGDDFDVLEHGWIPTSRRRIALTMLYWDNGSGGSLPGPVVPATRRVQVVLEAEAEALDGAGSGTESEKKAFRQPTNKKIQQTTTQSSGKSRLLKKT